jgi:hypothetical protein
MKLALICVFGVVALADMVNFYLSIQDREIASHQSAIVKANNDYKIEILCKSLLPDRASACLKLSVHERYKYDAFINSRPGEDFNWTR